MIYLVNSYPQPSKPSEVADNRLAGWRWIDELLAEGVVLFAMPKLGRGMIVIFDVETPHALQEHLQTWAEFVPCQFDVTALVDADAHRSLLRT